MEPNPYKTPAEIVSIPQPEVLAPSIAPETLERHLQTELTQQGFACESRIRIGPYTAILRCTKRGFHFPILYTDRFYVYRLSLNVELTLQVVQDIHEASRFDAERFHSRWIRMRIPNTATVVLHESPLPRDAANMICAKRLPNQSDRPHAIFTVGLARGDIHYFNPTGLFKSVNLQRSTCIFRSLIMKCNYAT